MRYYVNYIDPVTGANSCIDEVAAPKGYTAADYIADCDENSDPEWCEMLHAGKVELEPSEPLSISEFVQALFDACSVTPEPMDLETAAADLRSYEENGYDLPYDITPEAYMEAWNDLVDNQRGE